MPDMRERVIIALDAPTRDQALRMVEAVGDDGVFYKVGLELYIAAGDAVLDDLRAMDKKVFLDLKLFDIPNTVQGAAASVARKGVALATVHALGGAAMMRAARKGADQAGGAVKLLGVTILTSLDEETLRTELHIPRSIPFLVPDLAQRARASGLDGVVASGLELPLLREHFGDDFLIVTPGIRPAGGDVADQKRVLTPREAFARGASYIVVGRPVTGAPDPRAAFLEIADQAAG